VLRSWIRSLTTFSAAGVGAAARAPYHWSTGATAATSLAGVVQGAMVGLAANVVWNDGKFIATCGFGLASSHNLIMPLMEFTYANEPTIHDGSCRENHLRILDSL
jgi:hypothetical protein